MSDEDGWNWTDVEGDVTPRTDTVPLCVAGDVVAALEQARGDVARVKRANDTLDASAIDEAEQRVAELEEQARAATRVFAVRSIGYRAWRELVAEHPSDKPGDRWNPETFVPAAIAAGCDQFSSPEQVVRASESLSAGQIAQLFRAVRVCNEGDDRIPFSLGL